jgi:hypothetical protein
MFPSPILKPKELNTLDYACVRILFLCPREEHSVFGAKKEEVVMVDVENCVLRIFINSKCHHYLER